MDPRIIASLIQGIGSIASSVANYSSNTQTNRHNEELARQQNEWNLQQWMRENAYNSPTSQRQRLAQASINPGLMYQSGIQNIAAQSPQMVSSQNRALDIRNPLAGVADVFNQEKLTNSQIQYNDALIDKFRAETKNTDVLTEIGNVKLDTAIFDLKNMRPAQVKQINAITDNLNTQTRNLDEVLNGLTLDNTFKSLQIDKERFYQHFYMKNDFDSLLKLRESTIFKNQADAAETVYLMHSKLALNRALAFQANTQGNLNQELAKTQGVVRENISWDSVLKHQDAVFNAALRNSPGYIQSLIDSINLNNESMQLQIDITKGSNLMNWRQGQRDRGWSDIGTFRQIASTFLWSLGQTSNMFGFSSSYNMGTNSNTNTSTTNFFRRQ